MAALDTVVERATGVAAGMCVAALGGTGVLQSLGGAAVAGVGLYGVFLEATKKCRVECDRQLEKLAREVKARLIAENPAFADHYEDASHRLSHLLLVSFPTPQQIAALAVAEDGAIVAATNAVLADLNSKGAGFDRDIEYERFARALVSEAIAAAFSDRDYFPKLEPHLWFEALKVLGALKADTEAILQGQARQGLLLDEHRALLTEIVSTTRRIDPAAPDEQLAGLSPLLRDKKALAKSASRKHDEETALRLWEEVREQAKLEGNKNEEILAQLETASAILQSSHNPKDALTIADSCLQQAKGIELGNVRCQMLQLVGEMHRIKGNIDLARGFQTSALELARKRGSKLDEGMALLSMAAIEKPSKVNRNNAKQLELIQSAYDAFSAAYLTGDAEDQSGARRGFALCHCLRAESFDYHLSDDALAEWSRALETYRSLGEEFEWDTADTLLHRSSLLARLGEAERAAIDLDAAAKIFQTLENHFSLANCFLQAGELLDSMGRREDAVKQYEHAAAVAAQGQDKQRASYFYFRHACKLLELRKHEEAESIFIYLMNAEWLDLGLKLTIISQLCLISQTTERLDELKERCSIALSVVDELIADAPSSDEQRNLMLERCRFLSLAGRSNEALASLKELAERFRAINDESGMADAWFKIRGIMQEIGDPKGEREACEVILSLGEKGAGTFLTSLTLVQLAQLNIQEQRFREGMLQLDRATSIDPDNPAVALVAADLRTKLPRLSPNSLDDGNPSVQPPRDDFPSLIKVLHEWCALYPQKRKSILAIWYSIYRSSLWSIFQSMIA